MKRVEDSKTQQTHILRYQHLNGQRRLFGGVLMQWIDELATIVAQQHAECDVITAAVDNLQFKEPAFLNDLVVLSGKITFIGKTSMEVRVDTYIVKRDRRRTLINTAYLVMVATADEGCPVEVPPIELVSDKQKEEWAGGQKRYQLRKTRRKERF